MTLVNAQHHVAAMKRYPVLGGPEVSQKQALALAKVLDGLPAGEELCPNARRNPVGPPPPKDAKHARRDLTFQAFRGCSHQGSFASFGGGHGCPGTTLVLLAAAQQPLHVTIVLP
jgi:hypothetical protein